MEPTNTTFDVTDAGQLGMDTASRPFMPQPSSVNDSTVNSVGYDTPARDPDAIPITVNRVQPTTPAARPAEPTYSPAPAIADDQTSPLPQAQSFNTGQLFQPDSDKKATFNSHDARPPTETPMAPQGGRPKRGSKSMLWLLLGLIILAGVYLAADDGLIRGGSHLPYHLFSKYKTSASSTTQSSQTSTTTVPTGFSQYQLSNASIQFSAPTTWGTPSFSTDPGYSQRGGGAKSDSTHAYLVSFAQNKDVQLALTSPSALPASDSSNYYDQLQWCVGTIDHSLYLQRLVFTTTKGVDTPGTIVCDQGPLVNATQINTTTILEPSVKTAAGTILGDIYIENLNNSSTVSVIRALDTTMKNGDDIKTLLTTVHNL